MSGLNIPLVQIEPTLTIVAVSGAYLYHLIVKMEQSLQNVIIEKYRKDPCRIMIDLPLHLDLLKMSFKHPPLLLS